MHYTFHITETVKDRRALVLIQCVDLRPIFYEQSAYLRVGVHVGGMEGQMMQRVAFVHIEEVGINAKCQEVLYLFNGEVFASFYDLNERDFVLSRAEVYLTLVFSKDGYELVLAVERCVEDW